MVEMWLKATVLKENVLKEGTVFSDDAAKCSMVQNHMYSRNSPYLIINANKN